MLEEFAQYTMLVAAISFIAGSFITIFLLLILEMVRAAKDARELVEHDQQLDAREEPVESNDQAA